MYYAPHEVLDMDVGTICLRDHSIDVSDSAIFVHAYTKMIGGGGGTEPSPAPLLYVPVL